MEVMYQFKTEERESLERALFPLAAYQFIDGKVVTLLVSDGFCQFKGMTREDLTSSLDNSMFGMVHPDDAGRIQEIGAAFARKASDYDVIYRSRTADADSHYHLIHTQGFWQPMHDGTEVAFLLYTDLSSSVETMRRIDSNYFQAKKDEFYNDSLTGIPNINYYHAFLNEHVARLRLAGKHPGLAYLDLRRLTGYNGRFGFHEGDQLLRDTARILQEVYPNGMVTRFNDDHFVVVTDKAELLERAADVAERVREASLNKSQRIRFGVSDIMEADAVTGMGALERAMHAVK